MKLLLIVLIVCVCWHSVSAWGVHKTRANKTAKAARRHDAVQARQVTAHPAKPPHHPKPVTKIPATTRRAHGGRRHRVVHPRFRPLAKSTKKNVTHPQPTKPTKPKSVVKHLHRKLKAKATKSAVPHTKLLAKNVHPQTSVSALDAHHKEQIHGYFQQQHEHGPVQTRSRVKTGLKRRK
jgi:hypothetical protein